MHSSSAEPESPSAFEGHRILLSAKGIGKSFPGVKALDDISFDLASGSVHALMGENGAGKSTLMKILAGIYQPDSGEIWLQGEPVQLLAPIDALSRGIAMIHQELNLMSSMTVAENIWIGREPRNRLGFVDHDVMNQRTADLLKTLDIDLDPIIEVSHLSIANSQMVEIAKAVSYRSRILIMDEPTSALTEREAHHLFKIISELKSQGVGIIYISHKMNEILEIADDVSVLRDGKLIGTRPAAELSRDEIIYMMVGREVSQMFPKYNVPTEQVLISVRGLCLESVFSDVSFDLHAGEILGFAGLIGAGRSNVAETLFGITPAERGEVRIKGQPIRIKSALQAMHNGMAFLTEDRKQSGCFLSLDVQENMQIAALQNGYVTAGFVRGRELSRICQRMSDTLRIKTAGLHNRIEYLSGGNQQKVLIGRWLLTHPEILILDEPTRGIDVAAKAEIHALISSLAKAGAGVILISSEMPEILGMSDRVIVMHEGKVTGILDREEASQVKIMGLASR